MVQPVVSVIVVNYNGQGYLPVCFESLLATRYPADRLELIMVDGGSTDGSLSLMAERFPTVVVLKAERNNYCAANNLGIGRARGTYVALLNNDTRVDPGWLEPVIALLESRPEVGAAGSKILSMDGKRIVSVGHAELPNYYWADRGYNEPDTGQYDRTTEVASVTGTAVVYRRACLDEIGPLDEDFVMFVEDVDLGYRCRAKGWRVCVVPESKVHHVMHGSITEENARRWWERNRLLFVAKHHPEHLSVAWHGQGYYRLGTLQEADGRGAEALTATVAKLIREHGLKRAEPILTPLFHGLDQSVNLDVHLWVQRCKAAEQEVEQQRAQVQMLTEQQRAQVQTLTEPYHAQVQTLTEQHRAQVQTLTEKHRAQLQILTDQRAKFEIQLTAEKRAVVEQRVTFDAAVATLMNDAAKHRASLESQLVAAKEQAAHQRAVLETRLARVSEESRRSAEQRACMDEQVAAARQEASEQRRALEAELAQVSEESRQSAERRASLEAQVAAARREAAEQCTALEAQLAQVTKATIDARMALEAQVAAVTKAATEERAALEARAAAASREAAEQRQRWHSQQAALQRELESVRAALSQRDVALTDQGRQVGTLQSSLHHAQAQGVRLRDELAVIDRSVKHLLVVKAQQVPVNELEDWLRGFRQRCPQTRIGLFAHLTPDEYDRLALWDCVDESWLFSPERRPLTVWSLLRVLPRIWWRRYDIAMIPGGPRNTTSHNGYAGFSRARRLAWLMGARTRRDIPLACYQDVVLSEAVARSSTVTPGQMTEYVVGLTNSADRPQQVRLYMVSVRLQEARGQQNEVSKWSVLLDIPPRTTRPLTVQYDWARECRAMSNGSAVPLEHFEQVSEPQTTVYRIAVHLTDSLGRTLGTFNLFQRVIDAREG